MKQFGLSKSERIKRKKIFNLVYSEGTALYSNNNRFKAIYYIVENSEKPGIKTAFAVHKNAGTAVWRNRVKRLLRESYRLNKKQLINWTTKKNASIYLVLSPNNISQKKMSSLALSDVMPAVVNLMEKITDER